MGSSHPNLYLFIYLLCLLIALVLIYCASLFIFAFDLYVDGGGNKEFSRTALLSSLLMGNGVMDGKIILLWLLFA